MAIVKATYTKSSTSAKASIRYIEHRPGKDGEKIKRNLFGIDGLMGRWQANRMIDEAAKGSYFYRFALSPDPKQEDTAKDVHLREHHRTNYAEARRTITTRGALGCSSP